MKAEDYLKELKKEKEQLQKEKNLREQIEKEKEAIRQLKPKTFLNKLASKFRGLEFTK